MDGRWGIYGAWALRIVRNQAEEPILWHIIIDEIGQELDVTQCGDGSGAWVDLAQVNVKGGDLAALGQMCWGCAQQLGWFASRMEHGRDRGQQC